MYKAKQLMEIGKDCNRILPAWFSNCHILKLENETLYIGVPNQAVAARIRQKIPFLQNKLEQKGWSVRTIRLKVRFLPPLPEEKPARKKQLSQKAYEAFSELYKQLKQNETSSPLTKAVHQLLLDCQRTEN